MEILSPGAGSRYGSRSRQRSKHQNLRDTRLVPAIFSLIKRANRGLPAAVKEQCLDQVPESVDMDDYDLSFYEPSLQLLHVG
jgi:hypothetical protein